MTHLFSNIFSHSEQLLTTLIHFLWQGTLIVLFAGALSQCLKSARARYAVHVTALVLLSLSPLVTAGLLSSAIESASVIDTPIETVSAGRAQHSVGDDVELPLTDAVVMSDVVFAETPQFASDAPALSAVSPTEVSLWERSHNAIAGLYLLGVGLMLARLALSLVGAHRWRRSALLIDDVALIDLIAEQVRRLQLRTAPLVRLSEDVLVPTILGVLRPMVLLPLKMVSELTPDQLSAIIMHELSHIRRLDPLVNLFQRVAESLFFFHPAVWLLSRWLVREREICCDEAVVSMGTSPLGYAEALLRTAELGYAQAGQLSAPSLVALNAVRPDSTFSLRIRKLLGDPPSQRLRPGRGGVATACLAAVVILASTFLWRAQAEQPQAITNLDQTVDTQKDQPAEHDAATKANATKADREPMVRLTLGYVGRTATAIDVGTLSVVSPSAKPRDLKDINFFSPENGEGVNYRKTLEWAKDNKQGDFVNDLDCGFGLFPIRGARMISLPVTSWAEVEFIPNELLIRELMRQETGQPVSASFFAVLTNEQILAVGHVAKIDAKRLYEMQIDLRQRGRVGKDIPSPAAKPHHWEPRVLNSADKRFSELLYPFVRGYRPEMYGQRYWTAKDGRLRDVHLDPGEHYFVANAGWPTPTIIAVNAPDNLPDEVRLQPRDLAVRPQLVVRVVPHTGKNKHKLDVRIANKTERPYRLRKHDLSMRSSKQRVFPPASQQQPGKVVPPQGQGELRLTIDFREYLANGLWGSPPAGWNRPGTNNPIKDEATGATYFRLKVGQTESAATPLLIEVRQPSL